MSDSTKKQFAATTDGGAMSSVPEDAMQISTPLSSSDEVWGSILGPLTDQVT